MAQQKIFELKPQYCEEIPGNLDEGVLYISERFHVAIHLCACGCGHKAVTPFNVNNGWKLLDDAGKITLTPSIGNFGGEVPYHAHYFIVNNKIRWT